VINRWHGKYKERGIGKMNGRTFENPDIFECDDRVFIRLNVERITNLRSAIRQSKIAQKGVFKDEIRKIDFDGDRKGFWLGKIKSLEESELNNSMPLSLNHFRKDEL